MDQLVTWGWGESIPSVGIGGPELEPRGKRICGLLLSFQEQACRISDV